MQLYRGLTPADIDAEPFPRVLWLASRHTDETLVANSAEEFYDRYLAHREDSS
jgi:hypothetical protein